MMEVLLNRTCGRWRQTFAARDGLAPKGLEVEELSWPLHSAKAVNVLRSTKITMGSCYLWPHIVLSLKYFIILALSCPSKKKKKKGLKHHGLLGCYCKPQSSLWSVMSISKLEVFLPRWWVPVTSPHWFAMWGWNIISFAVCNVAFVVGRQQPEIWNKCHLQQWIVIMSNAAVPTNSSSNKSSHLTRPFFFLFSFLFFLFIFFGYLYDRNGKLWGESLSLIIVT